MAVDQKKADSLAPERRHIVASNITQMPCLLLLVLNEIDTGTRNDGTNFTLVSSLITVQVIDIDLTATGADCIDSCPSYACRLAMDQRCTKPTFSSIQYPTVTRGITTYNVGNNDFKAIKMMYCCKGLPFNEASASVEISTRRL